MLLCMLGAADALARSIHRAAAGGGGGGGGVGGHYAVGEGEFDILGNCRSISLAYRLQGQPPPYIRKCHGFFVSHRKIDFILNA